jgi:hypothetical protein
LLKYVPKRQEFDGDQMDARTTLAVIDHNLSQNRGQKIDAQGQGLFFLQDTHFHHSAYPLVRLFIINWFGNPFSRSF